MYIILFIYAFIYLFHLLSIIGIISQTSSCENIRNRKPNYLLTLFILDGKI